MKNITVSVDDDTYRKARIHAAENDTSVSALVKDILKTLAERQANRVSDEDFARLENLEQEARARLGKFSVADTMSRDEVYNRRR